MFAIITFRDTGPIKTWSDMRAANVHNARTKPLAHAMPGAPPPEHMVGGRDLVADVKRLLRGAKIDPDQLRKNGVIAYEAILSASAEFFKQGTAAERAARLVSWKAAQREWALARYGAHRVASMVLHTDEKVPHIHLVVVPLEVKSDSRRRDAREMRWGLVGRTISGPGRFDETQDAYAAAMAPFGLARGVRGSGRKHEPVPVYLARMAEKERAVDAAGVELVRARAGVDADRDRLAKDRDALEHRERQAADREAQIERDDAARRRLLVDERETFRREMAEERRKLFARSQQVAAGEEALTAGEADLAAQRASFSKFRDELIATRERLVPIFEAAKAFSRAAEGVDLASIRIEARPAVAAARRMIEASRAGQTPVAPHQHQHAAIAPVAPAVGWG